MKGKPLDWQVTSISQICSSIAPLLAQTEALTLGFHKVGPDPAAAGAAETGAVEAVAATAGWPGGDIAVDRAQWRDLLRSFAGVKTIQLTGGRVGDLLRAVQPRHGESNSSGNGPGGGDGDGHGCGEDGGAFSPKTLSALQKFVLRGWGIADNVFKFASFIVASDAVGRTNGASPPPRSALIVKPSPPQLQYRACQWGPAAGTKEPSAILPARSTLYA